VSSSGRHREHRDLGSRLLHAVLDHPREVVDEALFGRAVGAIHGERDAEPAAHDALEFRRLVARDDVGAGLDHRERDVLVGVAVELRRDLALVDRGRATAEE
jgi:hypothetical protein